MGANSRVSPGAPQTLMNPSNLSTSKVHRMTLRQKQEEKPKLDLKETIDGLCGPENGDTICGDWPGGSCCSAYGVGVPLLADNL